jgi:hypothetical protein
MNVVITSSDAEFSTPQGLTGPLYRLWLTRWWNTGRPMLAVIGMNPSIAGKVDNDPTIRKCIGFADNLNCGGLLVINVGAFVATDPREWRDIADPFGPLNTVDHLLEHLERWKPLYTVAAWGKIPSQRGQHRADSITRDISGLKCWGRNADGSPRHPSRIPYSTELEDFN